MNGIIGFLPRRQVASRGAASRRGNLQIVIVIDVAGRTKNRCVKAGERESRAGMVQRGGSPIDSVVAERAIKRITRRGVGRVRGPVVIRRVTRLAGCVGQRVVVVHVACGASNAYVGAR